jgi:hypothetical protein
MSNDRIPMVIGTAALSFALMACEGKSAPREEHAAGTTQAATGKAPAAAPAKASTQLTTGELNEGKGKVTFTIALPPEIHAVDEGTPNIINYRRGKKDFDGYNVAVGIDSGGKRALASTKAALLAEVERQKGPPKKGKLLDQGDVDGGGWYVAFSFEDGGKPCATVMSRIVKGDTVVMCRGDVEGRLGSTPAASAKVLIEACKSLVITSP